MAKAGTLTSVRETLTMSVASLALLAPTAADAQPRTYDPIDLSLIPAYCKYTQDFRAKVPGGNNPSEIDRYTKMMGSNFNHMHHYCWGLIAANHAAFKSTSQQQRNHNLGVSIKEFDYVIGNATSDFSLLPEIHTKKADSLFKLNRGPSGMLELQNALRIKADYWQAYAAMSDYYKDIGDLAKAKEALEKGLSVAPNTKALTDRMANLNTPQSKRKAPPAR